MISMLNIQVMINIQVKFHNNTNHDKQIQHSRHGKATRSPWSIRGDLAPLLLLPTSQCTGRLAAAVGSPPRPAVDATRSMSCEAISLWWRRAPFRIGASGRGVLL
jgi:hypothetical protein